MSEAERAIRHEELVMYWLLVATGLIPVVIAALTRAVFDREATLGLVMLGLGADGLIGSRLRART